MNAPSYKAAQHLIHILNTHLNLKNTYNVTQSTQLATKLSRLSITGNQRLITYDIKDLYVNIPINEVIQIIHNSLGCQTPQDKTTQIIKLTRTILSQNYFMFHNKIHYTNKGVAMGSPISNIIAEIFLQHYKNTYIKQALDKHYIQYYTRFVDDILIIYDNSKITHEQITQQFNQLHTNLTFNPSQEIKKTVNFLDLQITRGTHSLLMNIHRKPTITDTTIHYTSNHPNEHKTSTYRYHLLQLHSLPLNSEHKHLEWQTIQTMAKRNQMDSL
jgi:hypothetical protein